MISTFRKIKNGGCNLKKIGIIITILLLFSIVFPTIPVSAFAREVYDFEKIWYDEDTGFNKNGVGTLMMAISYTSMSFRNIDHCSIVFTKNPLYFSIEFIDELEIIRDSEGNIVYQESKDGYVFLRKSFVDSYLPQNIKRLASKNINYKTITYQGIDWYRIYVPDFNRKYEWKKYTEPSLNEKWYTWGSDESIEFETRAMFIELTKESEGSLFFDFNHPQDNSGQTMVISKSYLSSNGINNPVFEWGERIPWQSLSYTENSTHYILKPQHFSTVGIHEATTGTSDGGIFWGYETSDDAGILLVNQPTTYPGSPDWEFDVFSYGGYSWQSFSDTIDVVTRISARIRTLSRYSTPEDVNYTRFGIGSKSLVYQSYEDRVINDSTYTWEEYDPPDIFVNRNQTYYLILRNYDTYGNLYWARSTDDEYLNGRSKDSASKDMGFKIYGRIQHFDTTRVVGALTETDNVSFTSSYYYNDSSGVLKIRIPVSSQVKAITRVYNLSSDINATAVNSTAEIVNNTYFFDAVQGFVYIGSKNVSSGSSVTWQVNGSRAGSFSISFPTYKEVGDDILLQGLIKDANEIVVDGVLTKTHIYYLNGSIATGPYEWNCTNGNYYTAISTTALVPGIYTISVEFTDTLTGTTFKNGSTLYLSYAVPEGLGIYSDAIAIFNIYNTNLGLGLPKETLQVYVNDVRKKENVHYTYLGESLNITIKDYYNFTLISRTHDVTEVYTFIDLGITFHEYDFTNMNAEYFYASFLKSGANRWYEKVVASNGQKAFLLPTGDYTIRVYNADNSSYTVWTDTIDSSKAFLIGISGVTVIIEGEAVVDEPIEWRAPPIDDKSFIIPTKPPAYPEDPFTVLEMYDVLRVTSMPKSDAEITVVFLDTGFTSRTYGGVDLSNIIADKLPEYTSAYDKHGHGTWTSFALARIFATHLKNVHLISFKVFDDSGACTQEQMLEAFDTVKKLNPDVISFSGGGYGGPFDAISKKVEEMRSAGIAVVVAAGNYGPASGTILSPASGGSAICVGAIDPKNTILDRDDDIVTTWSSRGPVPSIGSKPDFTAPGESIRGPWLSSQATVSGTSMSTPLVAAGMALMWGNNKGILDFVDMLYFWDGGTIPNILEGAMADTAYEKDSANDYGWGIPDFDKANDAVYGRCLFLIILWFAVIVIAIVLIVYLWKRR